MGNTNSINGGGNSSFYVPCPPLEQLRPPTVPRAQSQPTNPQLPELLDALKNNRLDHTKQSVVLASDFGAEEERNISDTFIAWNERHIFHVRHVEGKPICTPNYAGSAYSEILSSDGTIALRPPEDIAIRDTDPSHSGAALTTYAEFRLELQARLMGYCINGTFTASLLADQGLYDLGGGKWMCCKEVPGQTFAPYAAMLLLEKKDSQEVLEIAPMLIKKAEQEVSNYRALIDFLINEGGPLEPVRFDLYDLSLGETIRKIDNCLHQYGIVLLITGNRARLIDDISRDEQDRITITFRDAYVGAQRKIADHDDFWRPESKLPRLHQELHRSAAPQVQHELDTHNAPQWQFSQEDHLVCMRPRTSPPIAQKPKIHIPV